MKHLAIALLLAGLAVTQRCPPAIQIDAQPQVFIMSDISNEPDDTQSLVRLLLHSDQYNITGMVATTSYWLNSTTTPNAILDLTTAYGAVVDNLNSHSAGTFPSATYLSSIVKSGHPVYGTAAIGRPLSSGAAHLIAVLDGMPDDSILHCQAWGGVNVLGEALAHVRGTRTQYDLEKFTRKIRVYTISDQDNAGVWIRLNFPQIPYIVSVHAWNQYSRATWMGISGDANTPGSDPSLVSPAYISQHFQRGPLGSLYPDTLYLMEGDSPALLHTMQNGVNGGPQDHPEWGGWGGRYRLVDLSRQSMHYADTADVVVGVDNVTYSSNQASVWRWRRAYQEEMAARVGWSLQGAEEGGPHPPVVGMNGSCGSGALELEVQPGKEVVLDASGTWDPDADVAGHGGLGFKWWQYRDINTMQGTVDEVAQLNFTVMGGARGDVVTTRLPEAEVACAAGPGLWAPEGVQDVCEQYHVILEVTGSGTPPIRRYKRAILKVQPPPQAANARKRDEL